MTASSYVGVLRRRAPGVAARGGPVQQAHGVLPVIADDPSALIQDLALRPARRLPIAVIDRSEVLRSGVRSHDVALLGGLAGPRA